MLNVGDKCRIREWDDMVEEFGRDFSGDIDCKFTFTEAMRYLCGRPFTIRAVTDGFFSSTEGTEGGWSISADMLERIDEENEVTILPVEDTDLNELLGLLP